MHHSMPFLVNDRVFTVLVVSFLPTIPPISSTLSTSIDMQLPVDLSTFPPAVQARSHAQAASGKSLTYNNPSPDATSTQKSKNGKKLVEGKYVSLEKVLKMQEGEEDGKVVSNWEMMTKSDAGGWLPQWMQNLSIPGLVAKDVPLVLNFIIKWKEEERRGS